MSCLRWVQMLLLLVIVQPLGLLAMPCHTSAEDVPVQEGHQHAEHHAMLNDSFVRGDAVVSVPSAEAHYHSCCGAGSLCLMPGCAASAINLAVIALRFSASSPEFEHYVSVFPDVPVSPLYRPPISL